MVRKSKSDQCAHGSFHAMIMIALISSLSSKMPTTVLILLFTGWEVRIGKYYVKDFGYGQSSQFFPNIVGHTRPVNKAFIYF